MTVTELFPRPVVEPDLTEFDVILVSTSGGKDSQTMLRKVCRMAAAAGVLDRVTTVHAELGRIEWDGTLELAREQAEHYGVPFVSIARPAGEKERANGFTSGDLLDHIESHGKFPSATTRYCTSDHKRGQVRKVMTRLAREHRARLIADGLAPRPCRILDCQGLRAEESDCREKRIGHELEFSASASTKTTRHVTTWLPILHWTLDEVWADIRESGVRYHDVYDRGMSRLSCSFCVLGSTDDLLTAVRLRPALAREYAAVEVRIGHTFQNGRSMADLIAMASERVEAVA